MIHNNRFFYTLFFAFSICFWSCSSSENNDIKPKPNMRELDWSGKGMQQLSEIFAQEYPNLERLYLDNNEIKALPNSLADLKGLLELSLSKNELTQLSEAVGHIPNIEILNISGNHFSELPAAVLKLQKLRTLDLRHNDLKDLPETIKEMPNLKTVYIYGNPFTTETRQRFRDWMPNTLFVWYDPNAENK